MTLYVLGAMIVVSIALIVYALWPSSGEEGETIKRRMAGRKAQTQVAAVRKRAKESVAKRVMETVAPIAVRPGMKQNAEEMSRLRMKLATAGFRSDNAPTTFLASKTIVAICLGAATLAFAWAKGYPLPTAAGIIMIGAGIGFLAPDFWLNSATGKRKERKGTASPWRADSSALAMRCVVSIRSCLRSFSWSHSSHRWVSPDLRR